VTAQKNTYITPRAKIRRKFYGIPHDQVFESDTLKEAIDGKKQERNGLTPSQLTNAAKVRSLKHQMIKNALTGISDLTSGMKYSFYKRNPNLLCTNGGILMMREKSTMEVIAQMGQAGQLSLIQS